MRTIRIIHNCEKAWHGPKKCGLGSIRAQQEGLRQTAEGYFL